MGRVGTGLAHERIKTDLLGLIHAKLWSSGGPCQLMSSEIKVLVKEENSYFYPDLLVACPPDFSRAKSGIVANPKLIIEILSPSTEADDRVGKFEMYQKIPSLQEYVFVSSTMVWVERFARQGGIWPRMQALGQVTEFLMLDSIALSVPVSEIYRTALEDGLLEVLPTL